jgi:hypothetical protein
MIGTCGHLSNLLKLEFDSRDYQLGIQFAIDRSKILAVVLLNTNRISFGLQRVRTAWDDCQASRDRNAIYGYLTAVYGLVAWWTAEGREIERARRALRLVRWEISDREDPFAAIIRCTADPAKADKRTRSKRSRVMRYAVASKPDSVPLDQFIRRKGGINACATRFSRRLGRGAANRSERAVEKR